MHRLALFLGNTYQTEPDLFFAQPIFHSTQNAHQQRDKKRFLAVIQLIYICSHLLVKSILFALDNLFYRSI